MLRNKTLFLTLAASVVVFIVFVVLVYFSLFAQTSPRNNIKQENTGASTLNNPTLIKEDQRSSLISGLIDLTPHSGKFFSLYFTYKTYSFVLYVDTKHQKEGNANFDSFLKQNGITNRSWINNLSVENVNIAPTP